MPVPSNIAALSSTAAANFPLGSEPPGVLDDYLRAHAAFIAQLRDGKANIIPAGTTAQYLRGDSTWQDLPTAIRAAVLTGLSTASSANVAATDTVLAAIGKLQARTALAASETVRGNVELATAAETITGTDTTRAAHPAGVKAAIAAAVAAGGANAANGWVPLNNGTILQWGTINATISGTAVTFPLAFPNNVFNTGASPNSADTLTAASGYSGKASTAVPSLTGMTVRCDGSARWYAIGN